MPLVSDNWMVPFPLARSGRNAAETEKEMLRSSVAKAHAKGRRVRFWAIPSNPAVWGELAAAGVDLINTDDLPGLAAFLRERPATP